jgi:hypothetical protein
MSTPELMEAFNLDADSIGFRLEAKMEEKDAVMNDLKSLRRRVLTGFGLTRSGLRQLNYKDKTHTIGVRIVLDAMTKQDSRIKSAATDDEAREQIATGIEMLLPINAYHDALVKAVFKKDAAAVSTRFEEVLAVLPHDQAH